MISSDFSMIEKEIKRSKKTKLNDIASSNQSQLVHALYRPLSAKKSLSIKQRVAMFAIMSEILFLALDTIKNTWCSDVAIAY